MPQTSHRTSTFSESVIRRMTRVANQHGAVNLSQGFPDFDPPQALLRAAERTAREGPHQYAITWGAQDFRAALAKKQARFMGLPLDPEENFVVTCGSTEAMMVAMMTACNPGDKVIVFSPFYENYAADAILSGAQPIYVPLHPPEFSFDPDDLAYIEDHYIHLDHEQYLTMSGGASYNWDGTRFSADLLYGSGLRKDGAAPNGLHVPGYTVVNLGVSHDFDLGDAGDLTARADLINAFDEKYEIRDGTGIGVGAPQWGARRGLFFGLSKSL